MPTSRQNEASANRYAGQAARYAQAAAPTTASPAGSLTGVALREALGILNSPGTYVEGTPGYTISRAGERAAATSAFDQARADRDKITAQAVGEVQARRPAITAGYQKATDDIRADAAARKAAALQRDQSRDADAMAAAAAMGLSRAPQTQNTIADQTSNATGASLDQIATAWAALNSSQGQRALERNDAVGDAFTWEGSQQHQILNQLLSQTLAGLVDEYVAGTAGHYEGGLTANQRFGGFMDILGYDGRTEDRELAAAKFAADQQRGASGPQITQEWGPNNVLLKTTARF